jgi:uncharacterized integral membrane protein
MSNDPWNSDRPVPIVRLILLAIAIVCVAAILLQNLQPLVTVYFLGQATIPIPLSLAILAAFLSGAVAAAIANLIADWLSRRNSPASTDADEVPDIKDTPGFKDTVSKTPTRSPQDNDDYDSTPYPRSTSKTTLQDDDDDLGDDDDDDDRDEIFVKYIKK